MEREISSCDTKSTKIYRIILGTIGGLVGLATLGLGVYAITDLSLGFLGGLLILGVAPADVALTCLMVKNAKVEIEIIEEDEWDEEIEEDDVIYLNTNSSDDDKKNIIQFDSIRPMVHASDEVSKDTNGMSRKRVIQFQGDNKKK